MTREYKYSPYSLHDQPFNFERCKASVPFGGRSVSFHQCSRKPWKDGWCKQHHPESEAKRQLQSERRWQMRREASPSFQLEKALKEVARLKARIAELEASE